MDVVINPQDLTEEKSEPFPDFFETPFIGLQSLKNVQNQVKALTYPRKELGLVLQTYNRAIGNDQAASDNILRLAEEGSYCVVTGQQLGFAAGPAYTVLKGISCLLAAKSSGAVPIFWLATEDHDINEISTTYALDEMGDLKRFHLTLPSAGQPAEDLHMTEKNVKECEHLCNSLGIKNLKIPKAGDSYAKSMANWLATMFAGTGLVFAEPHLLRSLAVPFFLRELKESASIQTCLAATAERLKKRGGETFLTFKEGTNLFIKDEKGLRVRLKSDGTSWRAGEKTYSLKELVSLAETAPERFSTNVASRPLLQNTLFPTIAYIAGPAEIAYHRHLADYHRYCGVPMPCIVPRINASLLPPYSSSVLKACGLAPWDPLPGRLEDLLPSLGPGFGSMTGEWRASAERLFGEDLSHEAIDRYVRLGAEKLRRKIVKKRLSRRGVPSYALHLLHNLLYPRRQPQERVLNWLCFQALTDQDLIGECLKKLDWTTAARQYIYY